MRRQDEIKMTMQLISGNTRMYLDNMGEQQLKAYTYSLYCEAGKYYNLRFMSCEDYSIVCECLDEILENIYIILGYK